LRKEVRGGAGRAGRRLARRWLLLAPVAAACATSPSISIDKLPTGAPPPGRAVSAFNVEAELDRGRFLEVGRYLSALSEGERAGAENRLLEGRVALARGDLPVARAALEAALASLAGSRRADAEWALSQTEILADDFRAAARHASAATRAGLFLSPGFVRFLEAFAGTEAYRGIPLETRLETAFAMGPYDLIRMPASVNGRDVEAVLDTGASYSIVTRSFAERAGVREIADSDAYGLGLHQKPIPLTFGIVDDLVLAGGRMTSVPVMIMPDEALTFDTARGSLPISAVIGLHLLTRFEIEIDYAGRRLAFVRREGPAAADGQNLFFARGKVMARVTADESPWTLFLLDTGSELTMLTGGGIRRLGIQTAVGFYPKQVAGIGKARVSWGKVPSVAIGVAGYRLRFRDMVVAETEETLEDGVLGSSALAHFQVRIDFRRMRLELEEKGLP
jgi:hypothetical protein